MAEDTVAPRKAVLAVVLVQKLRLEAGDVHVGGALALAGFTLQEGVEYVVKGGVGKAREAELAGQRQAQGVGTAAGAVLLLTGRLVGRAHRPAAPLAALAHAGAQLGGPRQPPLD